MVEFTRFLPPKLADELGKLAAQGQVNWWQEIQNNDNLHVAIREDYLSVYANGQSVFKIALAGNASSQTPLVMSTHYKYLLKPSVPSGKEYATFDGLTFLMGGKPVNQADIVQQSYRPKATISELIRTAIGYSNPEKRGVHAIAKANPEVLDVEIAFRQVREPEDPTKLADGDNTAQSSLAAAAQRIDLAALEDAGAGKARLVFYEAKRFDDGRLWGAQPEVLKQLRGYDAFLKAKESRLKSAYESVCQGLVSLSRLRGARPVPRLIEDVAAKRRDLIVDKVCRLIVFGFDQNQKDGRLTKLEQTLGSGRPILKRGTPKGLKLRLPRAN